MPHLSVPQGDYETLNRYYEECKLNQTPYVICFTRRTLADIQFDFEPLNEAKCEILRKNAQAIADLFDDLLIRYPRHKMVYSTPPGLLDIASMPRAEAEAAAKEIFDFMSELLNAGDETALHG